MSKKREPKTIRNNPGDVPYKCIRCSYVHYKKQGELPPTFCPNCAVNYLKGKMIRLERV